MTELLTEVTYGRVHGRFIVAEGDNTDPDAAADDVIPQAGTVTFVPTVESVQFPGAVPPVTVTMKPVTCELDAQGYLIDSNGKRGIWLVATDDTDGIPAVWGYKVTERFDGVKTPRIYTIAVPAGGEVDLASAAPPSPATLLPASIVELIMDAIDAAAAVTSLIAEDHGSVSGSLVIDEPGSHELDLTGNLEVTVETEGDVTLFVHGTADTITVAGVPFVVDGDATIVVVTTPRGVQIAYSIGEAEAGTPDTTPPTAPSALTVTPGSDGTTATAAFTLGTDAESVAKHRYVVYPTAGSQPAWPTSGAAYNLTASPIALTGLTPGTPYTMKIQAYSSGGAQATVATATFTTPTPAGWSVLSSDDFTAADNTAVHGRVTPVGGVTWVADSTNKIVGNKVVVQTGTVDYMGYILPLATSGATGVEVTFDLTLVTQADSSLPYVEVTFPNTPVIRVSKTGASTQTVSITGYNAASQQVTLAAPVALSGTTALTFRRVGNVITVLEGSTVVLTYDLTGGYSGYVGAATPNTVNIVGQKMKLSTFDSFVARKFS